MVCIGESEERMAAQRVGMIKEIWRYPVSSLGGELLAEASLEADGLAGDRRFAVVDARTGQPAQPESEARWHPALFLSSRWMADSVEIRFPDGEWLGRRDRSLDARLSDHFGFEVALRPYAADGDEPVATQRYGLSPVHIISTGSLAHLAELAGRGEIDCRRFRPNLLVETDGSAAFQEKAWLGHGLRLGEAALSGLEETRRCGMTLIPQTGIEEDADLLRSILRHNRRNFGIYCAVDAPGRIAVGQPLEMQPPRSEGA
jgi:uncharacterized protein YcbX